MLLLILLLIPVLGIFVILTDMFNPSGRLSAVHSQDEGQSLSSEISNDLNSLKITRIKFTALSASIVNLFVSLIIFILFDFSSNQFQFVQEYHEVNDFHIYLGVDGISIYFVLLTTIITPIALLSN
jgi:hypothetical protein